MKFEEKLRILNENEIFQSAMTYEEDQRLILNTEKHISYDEEIAIDIISKTIGLSLDEVNNFKLD